MRIVPPWADSPAAGTKFDRNAVEIPRYVTIEKEFSGEVQRIVRLFQSGDITSSQARRSFSNELLQAETEAYIAGRRARGDIRNTLRPAEIEMLNGRHVRTLRFFANFLIDIKAGRGKMNYMRRAELYAHSLWSIYTRGETSDWENIEAENVRFHWHNDPEAEHCKDCLDRAKRSRDKGGFTLKEMIEMGWPGELTDCLTECRCHVEVRHKAKVLPERYEPQEAAQSAEEGLEIFEELLGGPGLPLKVPAAGLPFVSVKPAVVEQSLRSEGSGAAELARRLPLVPKVLTRPALVTDYEGVRLYSGYGLTVAVHREADGMWRILALTLLDHQDFWNRFFRRRAA